MLITDMWNNSEINIYTHTYNDFNCVCAMLWEDKHSTIELAERYTIEHISDYIIYESGEKPGKLIEWFYNWMVE